MYTYKYMCEAQRRDVNAYIRIFVSLNMKPGMEHEYLNLLEQPFK
jgi:hypothetical protein